jgi:hypothetical protein
LAWLEGMRLTTEWIRQPTRMESDCVTLIKALSSTDPSRASWLEIITEIKELSRLLLSVVSPMFEVWQTKVLFLNICRFNFFINFEHSFYLKQNL